MTPLLLSVHMDACGELLVTHDDGHRACLDPMCDAPDPVRHDWRVECGGLDEPCRECAPPAVPDRHRRAA
jgi:hypothetical protein